MGYAIVSCTTPSNKLQFSTSQSSSKSLRVQVHSHFLDHVFRVVAPEVVPALVVATAQQTGGGLVIDETAAVIDVGEVVVNGAHVTEVDVLFGRTLTSCSGR